ncbi:MAG: maleylpyruvate isomerase family mycothiol-dependent enzyme, partial [Actinomycetota bacterium]
PNWKVADLVGHVASVFNMVSGVLESDDHPGHLPALPAGGVDKAYDDALSRLLRGLDETDPALERWNWSVGPHVAGFWWRRMAHETAVHRWDAESAVSASRPLDPDLAADGIDEWFDVHLRSDITDPDIAGQAAGTIQIQCLDTPNGYWASLADRTLVFQRSVADSDVTLRGGTSDLLLLLWGRVPPETVEVIGDASVLQSWLDVPDI